MGCLGGAAWSAEMMVAMERLGLPRGQGQGANADSGWKREVCNRCRHRAEALCYVPLTGPANSDRPHWDSTAAHDTTVGHSSPSDFPPWFGSIVLEDRLRAQ